MKINIQLSEMEKEFIKYAKNHFKEDKRFKNKSIIQGYAILYDKYYGMNHKENKNWKYVIFEFLYKLLLKINDKDDEMYIHLGITKTLMNRLYSYEKRKAIDRGLEYFHGNIAFTRVITKDDNGNEIKRFEID